MSQTIQNSLRMIRVPLDQLFAHPDNDYPVVQRELDDLKDSIRREGLAQLPLVRPWGSGYQIIAGHRRVECFRMLAAEGLDGYSSVQKALFADYSRAEMSPKQLEKSLSHERQKTDADAERMLDAMIKQARQLRAMQTKDGVAIDLYRLGVLERALRRLHKS